MRKVKIKDDNGKLIEIDIEKFKKHLDEYHSTGSSLHEENDIILQLIKILEIK